MAYRKVSLERITTSIYSIIRIAKVVFDKANVRIIHVPFNFFHHNTVSVISSGRDREFAFVNTPTPVQTTSWKYPSIYVTFNDLTTSF